MAKKLKMSRQCGGNGNVVAIKKEQNLNFTCLLSSQIVTDFIADVKILKPLLPTSKRWSHANLNVTFEP